MDFNSRETLKTNQSSGHSSCANSGNNSPTHPTKMNDAAKYASTTEVSTSGVGGVHVDQVSKNDSKVTSKSNRPHKLAPSARNISDFSTQSPRTKKPSNFDPATTSPRLPAGVARGMSTHSKNTNQGPGSGANSCSESLESTSATIRPHTGGDVRWEAINMASRGGPLNLKDFRLLKRIGYGDIGSVYLVELKGTKAHFAMKVMDKAALISRNKLLRAQTEREILGLLDHPFLPTLYSYFETDKFYCLVMEFCSGGDLHSLRQKQLNKCFTEEAASPTLVKSSSSHVSNGGGDSGTILYEEQAVQTCTQSSTFFPRILPSKKNRKAKSDFGLMVGGVRLPELMAEPTNVRSMSFVGTHEYLAPEIIKGEGHGSAVDWWTFGIFLYELLHGTTPFKGAGYKATLFNVVGQPLRFPETPQVSAVARDLIRGLLVKEPQKRIAYKRGATEIKQHPFFEGMNWALVRSATPPHIPEPVDFSKFASKDKDTTTPADKKMADIASDRNNNPTNSYIDFEYF
ncbi:unnamed protein product [Lupinus luteus]|uniref:non-specific serine/threonine protein kinase n=1 Tax=Lupinus luteus TaxID=3873 RepID=A0AAV1WLR5_LUPLU